MYFILILYDLNLNVLNLINIIKIIENLVVNYLKNFIYVHQLLILMMMFIRYNFILLIILIL
jgi:hypothetical protein